MTLPTWWSWRGLIQHASIGLGVTLLCVLAHAAAWLAVLLMLAVGVWHETVDGDFMSEAGAPYNGLLDVAAFLLVPLIGWWLR